MNKLSIHEAMDNLFKNARFGAADFPSVFSGSGTMQYPQVDLKEGPKQIKVKATIPGLKPSEIKIEVTKNTLTLSGSHKEEKSDKGENFVRQECYTGSFQRSFMLPADIDTAKVKAVYKDGILEISLPKAGKKTATKKAAPKKKAAVKKATKKAAPKKKAAVKKATKKAAPKKKAVKKVAKKTPAKKKVIKKTAPKKRAATKKKK